MALLDWLRTLDPRALALAASFAVLGIVMDRVRVARARRRVEDYLRAHRYVAKRIRRRWRPFVTSPQGHSTIRFEVEAYDLEFDTRRRGWASAASRATPQLVDDVRVEWEGEPEAFGAALPPVGESRTAGGRVRRGPA